MLSHQGAAEAPRQQPQQRKYPRKQQRTGSIPSSVHRSGLLSVLVVLLLSWALIGTASAAHLGRRRTLVPARKTSLLLIDTSTPPFVKPLMPPAYYGDATKTAAGRPDKRKVGSDPKASGAFEIPRAFDSALSNNFTSSCAGFFKTMLTGETINQCHPFSLMLQTSSSLFQASKSFVRITQTLEATCAANKTECVAGTQQVARQLLAPNACKTDYDNNNPQVVQAYNGLIAYEPMYLASCLRDDDGSYCYANAVTNTTSEGADAVPFYLPLGVNMPGGQRPTCNSCLQDEMAIFSSFSNNGSQPLSRTYAGAASTISMYCGNAFVNVTAAPLKGAAPTTTATMTPALSLLIMILFFFFQ